MPARRTKRQPHEDPGGRPQVYTDTWIEEEADRLLAWMELPESIFLKSFAVERKYHPNRLQEFADKNQKFSGVLELAKSWQESRLITYSLFNKINCGMTKFVLANHHGYCEKTQVSGDVSNPLALAMTRADGSSKALVNDGK